MNEVGFVVNAKDYLLKLEGLPSARINDLLVSKSGARALVAALNDFDVEGLMLDATRPQSGEAFYLSREGIRLPRATSLLGRVVNPLGKVLDGREPLPVDPEPLDLDVTARGIAAREVVSEQLITGITTVDTLIPIGKGQKEAVFGEPRSGKTAFIIDVIGNQKDQEIVCIYTAVGRTEMDIKRLSQKLTAAGADEHTVIISASPNEPVPLVALTPTIAFAVAEKFQKEGRDVLLIIDDLGTHAKFLREIALLSGRTPGRESYPGDIFYQHAHLIERAGNYNQQAGGGSITLLPVMETAVESMSYLLPTNLIASTDGHLFFDATLYSQGQYPAVKVDASVTRVGRQTQTAIQKRLAERIRNLLADYEEFKTYSLFGAELSAETRRTLKNGELAREILKQETGERFSPPTQILMLSLIFTSFFREREVGFWRRHRRQIIKALQNAPEFKALKIKLDSLELDEVINLLNQNLNVLEAACRGSKT